MTGAVTHPSPSVDPRRWAVFAVVLAAGFMDLLDVTIVNVAVPSIQADLDAEYSQVQWIVSGYVLAFAAVLITGGRLGDIYGRKRLFLIGVAGFTAASLACGLSTGATMLIASVGLQGAFAGLMVPQILATVRTTFPAHERAKAIGVYGGVAGSASAVGLVLGGVLIDADVFGLGWRAIYLINIPVGIVALVAAAILMPDSRPAAAPRLDVPGMILSIAAALLLVYPLTEGRRLDWPTWTFVMIGASAVVFAAFVAYERVRTLRRNSPLVDLALFRSRPFSVGLLAWLLFWIAFGGFFLIWTLYMQVGLGWSPLRAGLTASLFAVGAGVGAGVSVNALAPRFGRRVLTAGALIVACGFILYGWLAAHYGAAIAPWQMMIPLIVIGLGFGMVVAPTIDLLLGQVPSDEAGAGAGVLNTGQQLGMALGVALVGVLFFTQLGNDADSGVEAVSAQTRAELTTRGVPTPVQDEILAGFGECVGDRARQVDPSAVPDSCRTGSAPSAEVVAPILTRAGTQANAVNFADTFRYTLWFGTGLLTLVALGFLALPRNARLEVIDIDTDEDEAELV